ncbi:MAG TPA: diacylglycerol kinase family protein [Stellaceae bacterium]|nr:diacylglycerol kinase family protein [Stellaceae bacterium]
MPDLTAMPRRPNARADGLAEVGGERIDADRDPRTERQMVVVILNVKGGSVVGHDAETRDQIVQAFVTHGIVAEVILSSGKTMAHIARDQVRRGAGVPSSIVAGGGDGTVRTIAQELAGGTVALGILPLGTLNHFARDLGLPLDIPGAVSVIAGGVTATVDAAEVNGRIFVNNSSIGFYPTMVRDRDRQIRQTRRAKWLAMALALLHVLRRPIARRLTIEAADLVTPHRTPFAFIGNNVYDTTLPALGRRATLSGGELCLFVAKPRGRLGVLGLLLRAAFGRLDQAGDFEQHRVKTVTVRSRHRHLTVALDGEICRLHTPLRYRIRPAALRVLVPPERQR